MHHTPSPIEHLEHGKLLIRGRMPDDILSNPDHYLSLRTMLRNALTVLIPDETERNKLIENMQMAPEGVIVENNLYHQMADLNRKIFRAVLLDGARISHISEVSGLNGCELVGRLREFRETKLPPTPLPHLVFQGGSRILNPAEKENTITLIERTRAQMPFVSITGSGNGLMEYAMHGVPEEYDPYDMNIGKTQPGIVSFELPNSKNHEIGMYPCMKTRIRGFAWEPSAFVFAKGGIGTLEEWMYALCMTSKAGKLPIYYMGVKADEVGEDIYSSRLRNVFENAFNGELKDRIKFFSQIDPHGGQAYEEFLDEMKHLRAISPGSKRPSSIEFSNALYEADPQDKPSLESIRLDEASDLETALALKRIFSGMVHQVISPGQPPQITIRGNHRALIQSLSLLMETLYNQGRIDKPEPFIHFEYSASA